MDEEFEGDEEDFPPFRHPLFVDSFGLYITAQQMQHYLTRPDGEENFNNGNIDFFKYFNYCRIYNLLYDASEKSPDEIQMYWDDELDTVAFKYKKGGKMDKYLRTLKKKKAFFGSAADTKDMKFFRRGDSDEELY
jgi:hypothetical protein